MLSLLHELDRAIIAPLQIEICGGSCGILNHWLSRVTSDIDVMRSSLSLQDNSIFSAIKLVAEKTNSNIDWINDNAKALYDFLPLTYTPITEAIPDENFTLLDPRILSKADFIITKLATIGVTRQHDITDVKSVELRDSDKMQLEKQLKSIASTDAVIALRIESVIKQTRPDLVGSLNAYELADYSLNRFGRKPTAQTIAEWESDINNMIQKAGIIAARIDWTAAMQIEQGDADIARFDWNYRTEKELDHGMGL